MQISINISGEVELEFTILVNRVFYFLPVFWQQPLSCRSVTDYSSE